MHVYTLLSVLSACSYSQYCMAQMFDGTKFWRIEQSEILTSKILTNVAFQNKCTLIIYFYYYMHLLLFHLFATPCQVATLWYFNCCSYVYVFIKGNWYVRLVTSWTERAFAVHVYIYMIKTRHIRGWPCFSVSFVALLSVYHEKYTRSLSNFKTPSWKTGFWQSIHSRVSHKYYK